MDVPRFSGKAEPRTQKAMYNGLSSACRTIASELGIRRIPVGNTFRPAGEDADYARFLQETAHQAVERAK